MCRAVLLLALLVVAAVPLASQSAETQGPWTLRLRGAVAGGSHHSAPARLEVYSGLGLEAGVERALPRGFSLAFLVRPESREVDSAAGGGVRPRLGSLEAVGLTLLVQYRLPRGRWTPYVGLGAAFTPTWEKSGVLDTLDVTPGLGPALAVGMDLALSRTVLLNLDLRASRQRRRLEAHGARVARLSIDPLVIGVGVGIRP